MTHTEVLARLDLLLLVEPGNVAAVAVRAFVEQLGEVGELQLGADVGLRLVVALELKQVDREWRLGWRPGSNLQPIETTTEYGQV